MDKSYNFSKEFILSVFNSIKVYFNWVSDDVAYFIACQFALESDFGCSSLARNYCNYCGMKLPFTRLSVAENIDSDDEFAHYAALFDCVIDYFFLFQFNKVGRNMFQSLNSFKIALKQIGYCPEMDYINKINLIYQQFKSLSYEQRNC